MITTIVDLHKPKNRNNYDIYIGRAVKGTEFTKDSKWGNFNGLLYKREDSIKLFEIRIRKLIKFNSKKYNIEELRNKRLACWCCDTDNFIEPLKCHGQILLRILSEQNDE